MTVASNICTPLSQRGGAKCEATVDYKVPAPSFLMAASGDPGHILHQVSRLLRREAHDTGDIH